MLKFKDGHDDNLYTQRISNRNSGLAIQPLFLPVNCKNEEGYVALLSDPTVHLLYYDCGAYLAFGASLLNIK